MPKSEPPESPLTRDEINALFRMSVRVAVVISAGFASILAAALALEALQQSLAMAMAGSMILSLAIPTSPRWLKPFKFVTGAGPVGLGIVAAALVSGPVGIGLASGGFLLTILAYIIPWKRKRDENLRYVDVAENIFFVLAYVCDRLSRVGWTVRVSDVFEAITKSPRHPALEGTVRVRDMGISRDIRFTVAFDLTDGKRASQITITTQHRNWSQLSEWATRDLKLQCADLQSESQTLNSLLTTSNQLREAVLHLVKPLRLFRTLMDDVPQIWDNPLSFVNSGKSKNWEEAALNIIETVRNGLAVGLFELPKEYWYRLKSIESHVEQQEHNLQDPCQTTPVLEKIDELIEEIKIRLRLTLKLLREVPTIMQLTEFTNRLDKIESKIDQLKS